MAVIGLIVFLTFAGVIMVAVLFDNTPAPPPAPCDNKKITPDKGREEAAYRKFKKRKEKEEQLKRFEKRYKKEKNK